MPTSTRQPVNLQEIFNLIDKQGKGIIDSSKIGDLLRYSGLNPTEKVCSQIIGKVRLMLGYYIKLTDLEKLGKGEVNLSDFMAIYGENQDASLEFNSISDEGKGKNSLNSMINAVKTFDHQGTGYISINELKFSKS